VEPVVFLAISVIALIGGWFLRGYFPSYAKEKGKNLAVREDSADITRIIEEVRAGFSSQLEATKSLLAREVEALKHELAVAAEASKRYEELKASAYVDFYKAAAGLAIAQKWDKPEVELQSTIALTDAKARIAVYGSAEVATALGIFFKEYGHLSSPQAAECFIHAIELMRTQTVGDEGRVHPNVLARLFLGTDLQPQENVAR
jgi:hypothetical protein